MRIVYTQNVVFSIYSAAMSIAVYQKMQCRLLKCNVPKTLENASAMPLFYNHAQYKQFLNVSS